MKDSECMENMVAKLKYMHVVNSKLENCRKMNLWNLFLTIKGKDGEMKVMRKKTKGKIG